MQKLHVTVIIGSIRAILHLPAASYGCGYRWRRGSPVLLAWVIGAAGLVLSSGVDEGWLALLGVAGVILNPPTPDGLTPAAFVVDLEGTLLLAPRGSEHVACASGRPVLAAGELFIEDTAIVEATNQSTGYCPEPSSWSAVARALDDIEVARPDGYTSAFVFRRCVRCGQLNVVKDDWFECDVCSAALPDTWNCDRETDGGLG